jgi:hypothetical protein
VNLYELAFEASRSTLFMWIRATHRPRCRRVFLHVRSCADLIKSSTKLRSCGGLDALVQIIGHAELRRRCQSAASLSRQSSVTSTGAASLLQECRILRTGYDDKPGKDRRKLTWQVPRSRLSSLVSSFRLPRVRKLGVPYLQASNVLQVPSSRQQPFHTLRRAGFGVKDDVSTTAGHQDGLSV